MEETYCALKIRLLMRWNFPNGVHIYLSFVQVLNTHPIFWHVFLIFFIFHMTKGKIVFLEQKLCRAKWPPPTGLFIKCSFLCIPAWKDILTTLYWVKNWGCGFIILEGFNLRKGDSSECCSVVSGDKEGNSGHLQSLVPGVKAANPNPCLQRE